MNAWSLEVLWSVLTCLKHNRFSVSHQRDLVFELLKQFLKKHMLLKLFETKCTKPKADSSDDEPLACEITNLPGRLVTLHLPNDSIVYPSRYYKILISDMGSCLSFVLESVRRSVDVSLGFLALVLGRMCWLGYSGKTRSWNLLWRQTN